MALPNALAGYSDASSSYWPPGWNFARCAHSTAEDMASLSDEERDKMQAGLRDVLGPDGFGEPVNIMWAEELRMMKEAQKSKEQQDEKTAPSETAQQQQLPSIGSVDAPPDWLKASRQRYRDQPWGFMAFYLSPPSQQQQQQWQQQREKFQDTLSKMFQAPFNNAIERGHLEVNEARSSFEINWVEVTVSADDDDDDATILNHLRSRYQEMRDQQKIPFGLDHHLFLVANASSVSSVLAAAASTTPGRYWRPDAPFLLAVTAEVEPSPPTGDDDDGATEAEDDSEPSRHKTVFKVAVEAIMEELWRAVDMQVVSMGNLTRFVRGARLVGDGDQEKQIDDDLDDIWWSANPPPRHIRKKREF